MKHILRESGSKTGETPYINNMKFMCITCTVLLFIFFLVLRAAGNSMMRNTLFRLVPGPSVVLGTLNAGTGSGN